MDHASQSAVSAPQRRASTLNLQHRSRDLLRLGRIIHHVSRHHALARSHPARCPRSRTHILFAKRKQRIIIAISLAYTASASSLCSRAL